MDSEDSDEEKPKTKGKHKKSVDEDVKEVTKNIKNVSISNKSQKKKVVDSEGNSNVFLIKCEYTSLIPQQINLYGHLEMQTIL